MARGKPHLSKVAKSAALALALLFFATPAWAANPERSSFREPKADFHDKELALSYAFGPGALDFALLHFLSLGVAADQVFSPQNWYYRSTIKLVDNTDTGLGIAFNGGATQIREKLAGDIYLTPVWGWQAGLLVTLMTESGMILRGGFQLYDTDWGAPEGQKFLFTPEIAYRMSIVEITLAPGWPIWPVELSWIGLRLRL